MAVQPQTPYIEHIANGTTTGFNLGFDCDDQDHLTVLVDEVEPVVGTWSLSGGAVVFTVAPAVNKKITIQRNTPFERERDYQSYDNSFRPPAVNKDFDWIWLKLQELGVADWILGNRITALKNYVDLKDDELRAYLMEEIRKQGVALDQLDEYYNYLMERLAQIAVDKGWDASFVVSADGSTQQQVNDRIGNTWYAKPLGYELNARVMLTNGDIVKSTIPNNTNDPNVDMAGWVLESSKSVSNPSDLATLQNPKNKQRVYVESIQKTFVYDANLLAPENGVTIVGKWEMEIQDTYYASWFCEAESGVDESVKLQTGYDYAVSKKRAFIVDIKVDVNPTNATKTALWVRSNSVLGFVSNGELRMLANSATNYDLIRVQDVENYIIKNPVLRGDRLTHTGTGGEWGYGLTIYQSKNGYIHKPRIYNMWGDGIYIGKSWGETSDSVPTSVTVFEPYIEGVRRNGLSFTAGDNVHVIRPRITKVGDYDGVIGTWPKSGIDVEPEAAPGTPAPYMRHCSIESPSILDCYAGFYVYVFPNNTEINLHIKGITTLTRCTSNAFGLFHGGSNCTGLVQIDHVRITTAPIVAVPHAWSSDGKLFANVDRITFDDSITNNIIFSAVLNGAFTAKQLGNLTFNNIKSNSAFMPVAYDGADLTGFTDNTRYFCAEDSNSKLTTYGTLPKFGKDAYIDSNYIHLGFSIYTNKFPNNIWLDPLSDLTIAIYLTSTNDYRTLKIGLRNESANIGQGVNINGLNLLNVDGLVKTEAHCKTLGGWIKFRNVNGGRTQILDSYGVWTFS